MGIKQLLFLCSEFAHPVVGIDNSVSIEMWCDFVLIHYLPSPKIYIIFKLKNLPH